MPDGAAERKGREGVLAFLTSLGVPFTVFDHPPVFTCEEAAVHLAGIAGIGTKNLFLRNKKGDRQFLVSVPETKQVDLRALESVLGTTRLSFGSPERLRDSLGVEPGSVTMLALCNDRTGAVEFYVDRELVGADALQCHPLVNSATVVLSWGAVETFLNALDRPWRAIAVPQAEQLEQ